MSQTIAVAGKGGVGKTLIAGLLARHLAASGSGPVLAVDADANANLHEALGMAAGESVGAVREDVKDRGGNLPAGMTRGEYLEYRVESALSEGENLDLLVMGRPEGPGCYCYANNLLRDILGRVADRYGNVVIDNEAGMEHLSRRLVRDLDLLLIVSDPSLRGIDTALRLSRVPDEVDVRVARPGLVINRVPQQGLSLEARRRIDQSGLPLLGTFPEDAEVARCDRELGDLSPLFPASALARAIGDLALQHLGQPTTARSDV